VVAVNLFRQGKRNALGKLTDRITERGVLWSDFEIQVER
jgi:hypothetical protein